jgi:hypothetical protein
MFNNPRYSLKPVVAAPQNNRERLSAQNGASHRDVRGNGSSAPHAPPRTVPRPHNAATRVARFTNEWTPSGPVSDGSPPSASATPAPLKANARSHNPLAATQPNQGAASAARQLAVVPHQRHSTIAISRPGVGLAQVRPPPAPPWTRWSR